MPCVRSFLIAVSFAASLVLFPALASAQPAATASSSTRTACAARCTATAKRSSHPNRWPVPPWFVPQALCVHSGWHYTSRRPSKHARPEYRVAGRWWWRSTDIPDSSQGGTGEGAWNATSDARYGGGMSFTIGTWQEAGGHGSSTSSIAAASAEEQIYRAYVIVRKRGGWGDWPWTSRACGLR